MHPKAVPLGVHEVVSVSPVASAKPLLLLAFPCKLKTLHDQPLKLNTVVTYKEKPATLTFSCIRHPPCPL